MGPPMNLQSLNDAQVLTGVAALGAGLGIGQVLAAGTPVTWKLAAGRAIITSGLAVGGLSVLVLIPSLGTLGQIGVSMAVASVGTTGLEALLRRIFPSKE